jgi:hypothetical protein
VRRSLRLALVLLACAALAADRHAQEDWSLRVEPYLWVPALEGEGSADGSPDADFEIDYPGGLSAALPLAVRLEAPGGTSILFDGLYARWNDEDGTTQTETRISLLEGGVGFPMSGPWELTAGLRAIELDLEVELGGADAQATAGWIDPWIGGRGEVPLSEGWSVRTGVDIGGFGVGSDLTWQAAALLAWSSSRWRVELGYRALAVDIDDEGVDTELLAHGPLLGVVLIF